VECSSRESFEALEVSGVVGGGARSWADRTRGAAARAAFVLEGSSRWLKAQGRIAEAERAAKWASSQRLAARNPGLVRPLLAAVADAFVSEDDQAFLERALGGAICWSAQIAAASGVPCGRAHTDHRPERAAARRRLHSFPSRETRELAGAAACGVVCGPHRRGPDGATASSPERIRGVTPRKPGRP
jgi:hypothetical protein